MLGWALRHVAVATLVAGAFAALQGETLSRWLEAAGGTAPAPAEAWAYPAASASGHDVVIPAARDGHFLVEAVVDGLPLRLLVDTGASDVVLTVADAERLGFRQHQLDFSRRYQTANGVVRGAPVTLRELRIGQFSLFEVDASVTDGPLGISLLGMSFLGRLDSYAVADGRLMLRW